MSFLNLSADSEASLAYLTIIFLPALMYIPGRTVSGFTRLPCIKAQATFCGDIFSANIYICIISLQSQELLLSLQSQTASLKPPSGVKRSGM